MRESSGSPRQYGGSWDLNMGLSATLVLPQNVSLGVICKCTFPSGHSQILTIGTLALPGK